MLEAGPADHPAPFTDQLRLAVAAYLARFTGSSREHTESDLRCYVSRCAERGVDPLAAPVIAGTRLRGGNASSACGAASMITEAVSAARSTGCTGTLIVWMDSAFCGSPAVWDDQLRR